MNKRQAPSDGKAAGTDRQSGKVFTAIVLGKDPLVERLVAELATERAAHEETKRRYDKAVLAFGDESMECVKAQGRLEREMALTRHLQSVMENRAGFMSGLVHDLKNPLTVVTGYAAIIAAKASGGDIRDHVSRIEKAGLMMTETVDMILDFCQAEAGKLRVRHEKVDVGAEMAAVADFMQSKAAGKKVVLEVRAPAQVHAELDPRLLHHVAVNLISNGIKFSRQDGSVTVSVEKRDGMAVVSVRDTGIGIRGDELPHLFEPFYRGSGTTGIEGTGLGLVVVKRFTELMGGSVAVESELGKGAVFEVSFRAAGK